MGPGRLSCTEVALGWDFFGIPILKSKIEIIFRGIEFPSKKPTLEMILGNFKNKTRDLDDKILKPQNFQTLLTGSDQTTFLVYFR